MRKVYKRQVTSHEVIEAENLRTIDTLTSRNLEAKLFALTLCKLAILVCAGEFPDSMFKEVGTGHFISLPCVTSVNLSFTSPLRLVSWCPKRQTLNPHYLCF